MALGGVVQRFAVVIPVYNGRATLERCLTAVHCSTIQPTRLLVVDDSSSDGSGKLARAYGAEVIRIEDGPLGPAAARNRAAWALDTEIIVFVDADVEIHPQGLARLIAPFEDDPDLAATFGSYDDAPESQRIAAQYGNLRHHFIHQQSRPEASTFWSGFGAIRGEVLIANHGFDQSYAKPSIEDIELGLRISEQGWRIELVHDAQAKHLKDWSLSQLWTTDIFRRAIPWSRLLTRQHVLPDDLNISWTERVSAVSAHVASFVAVMAVFFHAGLLTATTALVVVWVVLNRRFLTLLARRGGLRLLFWGGALHWLYFLYSSASFAFVLLENLTSRLRAGSRPGIESSGHTPAEHIPADR